jgi:hypothetical protein
MAKVPAPKHSGKGAPPPVEQTIGNVEKPEPADPVALNFKVPAEFHREFKSYAARQGMSMLELLHEGFRLVKHQRGE